MCNGVTKDQTGSKHLTFPKINGKMDLVLTWHYLELDVSNYFQIRNQKNQVRDVKIITIRFVQ